MVALDEVDSTSDRAAQLVREAIHPLPFCVWAKKQSRGRGRGLHTWWSDSGSLTFTLALDPIAHGVAREDEPRIALAAAVAVIEAIVELGIPAPPLGIRWPNDIEFRGRKLAGILPESIETEHGRRLLIGIGINAMTDPEQMPAEIRKMATSLCSVRGGKAESSLMPQLLAMCLERFGVTLARLVDKDPELSRRWNDLDLLRCESIRVDLGTCIIAGRGCGIGADGALCLDDGNNRHRLIGGQVLR